MPVIEAIQANKFESQSAYYRALYQAVKMAYVVGREDLAEEILDQARMTHRKGVGTIKNLITEIQNR